MASSVSVTTPSPQPLLTPSTVQVNPVVTDDQASSTQATKSANSSSIPDLGAGLTSSATDSNNGAENARSTPRVVPERSTGKPGDKTVITVSQPSAVETSEVETSNPTTVDAEQSQPKSSAQKIVLEAEAEGLRQATTSRESITSGSSPAQQPPVQQAVEQQAGQTAIPTLLSTAPIIPPRTVTSDRPLDSAQTAAPAAEERSNEASAIGSSSTTTTSNANLVSSEPTVPTPPSLTEISGAQLGAEAATAPQTAPPAPSSQVSSLTSSAPNASIQTSPTTLGAIQTSTATTNTVDNDSPEPGAQTNGTTATISQTSANNTVDTTLTSTSSTEGTNNPPDFLLTADSEVAALQKDEVSPINDLSQATSLPSVLFKRSSSLAQGAAALYQFTVDETGIFTADLTSLSADADVQLIQDKNNNGQVDTGEIVAWEWEHNQKDESIRHFLQQGDYVLRVLNQDSNAVETKYTVATSFTASEVDDRAFSIEVIYKLGSEQLNTQARAAVERAADYWENVISHSSFDRPLDLALGLYGTTNETDPFLAYAGPQSYRNTGDNLLPVVGVAVLNNLYLEDYNQNPDYLESVLRHEIGHVLGLGVIWDKRGNDLVDQDKGIYRSNSYAGQSYGELLGTGVATDVPLDLDSLTHWDEEIFDEELMTPRAEGIGTPLPLSQLSISSLRDLGWNVNYGAAEAFSLESSVIA